MMFVDVQIFIEKYLKLIILEIVRVKMKSEEISEEERNRIKIMEEKEGLM